MNAFALAERKQLLRQLAAECNDATTGLQWKWQERLMPDGYEPRLWRNDKSPSDGDGCWDVIAYDDKFVYRIAVHFGARVAMARDEMHSVQASAGVTECDGYTPALARAAVRALRNMIDDRNKPDEGEVLD